MSGSKHLGQIGKTTAATGVRKLQMLMGGRPADVLPVNFVESLKAQVLESKLATCGLRWKTFLVCVL